jgi:hypothetical protein
MRLVFGQSAGADPCHIDNIPAIRIEGEALKDRSTGALIAQNVSNEWKLGGKEYFRLDVEGPVRLHFESAGGHTGAYGPFRHFSCADGIAYVDHQFFASLAHTTKMWHCIDSKEDWRAFEVTPA